MKSKLLPILIILSFISFPVFAKENSKEHKELTRQKGKMFEKELNLSADQIEKVKNIRQKYRPDLRSKTKAVEEAYKDLADGMKLPKKGVEYQTELTNKFKKLESLKNEIQQLRFQLALEIRELLTDEQIAKFAAMGGKKE